MICFASEARHERVKKVTKLISRKDYKIMSSVKLYKYLKSGLQNQSHRDNGIEQQSCIILHQ